MKLQWSCVRLIALVWLLLASTPLLAGTTLPATPHLRQITVADGMPSDSINGFDEDGYGYLWLATSDGLARYDGRNFRIWRIEDGLRDNMIWSVHVDARNRIWIGTGNAGLMMLSADRSSFHHYDRRGYPQMLGDTVWRVTSTPDGSVWFGTSNGGLNRLRPDGRMDRFAPVPGDPRSLPSAAVPFLAVTTGGTVWAGTHEGAAFWTGHDFQRVSRDDGGSEQVNSMYTDTDDSVWIGYNDGLLVHRLADGSLHMPPWTAPGTPGVLGVLIRDHTGVPWLDSMDGLGRGVGDRVDNVPLYAVAAHGLVKPNWAGAYEDREGGLWFASPNSGLWHLPANWQQFSVLYNRRDDDATVANPLALAVTDAADGRFWLAGTRGVLDLLDPATGRVEHHLNPMFGRHWPLALLEDRAGMLWATSVGETLRYDPRSGEVRKWGRDDAEDASLSGDIDKLAQAPDGRLWFHSEHGGMQIRDEDGHVLRTLQPGSHGLPQGLLIKSLQIGPDGQPWAATNVGLLAWQPQQDRFAPVPGAPALSLHALHVADSGVVWLASTGQLHRLLWRAPELLPLDSIGADDEFPALEPDGLVVDAEGVAWVTSKRGLIRVDPASRAVRVYGVHDGLPSQHFWPDTLRQSRGGQMIASTPDGLVLFDPVQVRPSGRQPPLVIERVGLRRGERGLDLSHVQDLLIEDGDRDLHIVARMLSFADSDANSYRFRLSGYDPDWIDVGPSGERLFSRLPAGSYRLEVQGRTADSVWSKVRVLEFRVLPPWWRSPWGLAVLTVLGVLLVLAAVAGYRRRLRRLHALQLAIHKQELAEQASLAKTRFLATLGHEVRTPMTGVLGMSELLQHTELDSRQRSYIDAIRQAGAHLLRLLNDALDLARIESGKLDLEMQPFVLATMVRELEALMAPLARERGLQFDLQMDVADDVVLEGDATRVRQILLNLLNNAVKFTERGMVALKVAVGADGAGVRFEVADTGPGINSEQKQRLFQRFQQGDSARATSRYGGSGLGLAISQELAVAMGGMIDVVSRLGAGTRFVVDLPLAWRHGMASLPDSGARSGSGEEDALPSLRILLVEDDATVAEVIIALLQTQGHVVVHAPHGLAALTEVADSRFDVALLDLDLPGLDGFALARQLRVFGYAMPLLAVTARADAEAEPAARAAGFDGFLRKPVTSAMLAEALRGVLSAPPG